MKEKYVTILMGDVNAKIGSNNRGYEEVMGTRGIGEMKCLQIFVRSTD